MAFIVLPASSGKHRRLRRRIAPTGTVLAGITALTAAGSLAATATAIAPAAPAEAEQTAFGQAPDATDSLAGRIAAQSDGQRKAAEEARKQAEAETKAKKEREARERAARVAEASKKLITWVKPVGSLISTPYHATSSLWSSGSHTGADFVAASGTPVEAVSQGTVVRAGYDGSYGNDVIIRMPDGMYTLYGHLSSVNVSVGQSVTPGRRIGLSGATGNVTGPHLHFEVRTTQSYGSDIDPVAYLRSHGVTI